MVRPTTKRNDSDAVGSAKSEFAAQRSQVAFGPPVWVQLPDLFAIGLAVTFFVLNLTAVLQHAMWRDEWYVWLFVRNCPSLAAILHEIWHTGRPVGWYVCCWFVNLFGGYPLNLKILHVLVSTGTVYLVAHYSPFTRFQKALFALSYYPFYEFGTILRDYDAELFLIVLAVVFFSASRRRPIAFGVALALLFQINAFGILIGLALGLAYVFDLWWSRAAKDERLPMRHILIGMTIAAVSLGVACWVMQTPKDTKYLLGVFPYTPLSSRLFESIAYFWRGCFPIPFDGVWNSNFLDPWPALEFVLGVILIVAIAGLLLQRPTAMIFYGVGILATIAFLCYLVLVANINQIRYQGHFFVVVLVALWLSWRGPRDPGREYSRMGPSCCPGAGSNRRSCMPFSASRSWPVRWLAPANKSYLSRGVGRQRRSFAKKRRPSRYRRLRLCRLRSVRLSRSPNLHRLSRRVQRDSQG